MHSWRAISTAKRQTTKTRHDVWLEVRRAGSAGHTADIDFAYQHADAQVRRPSGTARRYLA
jgi:hypothetical protein